jgi:hypothetical protein
VEGGSCNDYDYACGDPINNYDLDGTRCLTGVARRVQERRFNAKTGTEETKTREICRSAARGAKRAAENFDASQYFQACTVGAAKGAVTGALVGPEGAATGAAFGCFTSVATRAFKDAGADKKVVDNVALGVDIASGGYDIANASLQRAIRAYTP